MPRFYLLLSTFVLFYSSLFSQSSQQAFQRSIQWSSPRYYSIVKEQQEFKSGQYLTFKGAHYFDHNTLLPYYAELIPVRDHVNATVVLKELEFESLENPELLSDEARQKIAGEISAESHIYYSGHKPRLAIQFVPIRKNPETVEYERLVRFDLHLHFTRKKDQRIQALPNLIDNRQSVLSSGKWIKIRTEENGVYKLTYEHILDMGFENPADIKLFGRPDGVLPMHNLSFSDRDPIQNALLFVKGEDDIFNKGDYILFYGKSPDQWKYNSTRHLLEKTIHPYTQYNYYFLTDGDFSPEQMEEITPPQGVPQGVVTEFLDAVHYEKEKRNLIRSGRLWVDDPIDFQNQPPYSFLFPNLKTNKPVKFRVDFIGRSPVGSDFSVFNQDQLVKSVEIPSVDYDYTGAYARKVRISDSLQVDQDQLDLELRYEKMSASSRGWLDFITVNATRELKVESGPLHFRLQSPEGTRLQKVQLRNAGDIDYIWDVTDPSNAKLVEFTINQEDVLQFNVELDSLWREFIAFQSDGLFTPKVVGNVQNQNLHGLEAANMLIVTKNKYLASAQRLADLHRDEDDMKVHVVTDQQIYHEFSSGRPDPSAIRNFVRMIYERSTPQDSLKYLLLFGDGSYDNRESHTADFLMTYQSEKSLNYSESYVSDDFFGLLDSLDNKNGNLEGLVDIGIGRLTVQNTQQAREAVDKIEQYMKRLPVGYWLNQVCFVGDDEDNNLHMRDADRLAGFVDANYPVFDIRKIYLDNYTQEYTPTGALYPQVNEDIREAINNGLFLFNYTGHGGENHLAHEKVFTREDIDALINAPYFPVFLTATCEFTRYDDEHITSAGEEVFLNAEGGSIALFSTTRLVYAGLNYQLNRAFYDYVFRTDPDGKPYKMGDIVRFTKNNAGFDDNKRNFSLIGDPALTLPLGEQAVHADSVISQNQPVDTLKAMEQIRLYGQVQKKDGTLDQGYNGTVYIRVKGKAQNVSTRNNDGDSPFTYKVRSSNLFKGSATIENGTFKADFVIPKDLAPDYGSGKMNFIASDHQTLSQGAKTDFVVGGTSDHVLNDSQGPDMNLFLNDESFVSGGITDENPVLIGRLSDSSGVNISGTGIGHDLTATLDEDPSNKIVLNDFYQAGKDTYQKGKVEYQFTGLEKGLHTLELEAWDVNNNASTSTLEFRVSESAELQLDHVLNYPNPFTEQTHFYFEHNRPNESLDIFIQIFTVSGELVKSIHQESFSPGYRVGPIPWDGRDDFGDKIGKGVYLYRLKVRSEKGHSAEEIEKLVILK